MSYLVRGYSVAEAANEMHLNYKTLWQDMSDLKAEARQNMQHHISELPFHIRAAVDGLNNLMKILYGIADLDNLKAEGRKTSDHVRVEAANAIREWIKHRLEVLSSQGSIETALKFIDSTKQLKMIQQFQNDMEQVKKYDEQQSMPIMDALEKNNIIDINNNITP